MPSRVQATDPYIAGIRVGRKSRDDRCASCSTSRREVEADVFALKPVAEFGHRLVLDLYPLMPLDPLMALLESERAQG